MFKDQYYMYANNTSNAKNDDDKSVQKDKHLQNIFVNEYFKLFFDVTKIKSLESLEKKLQNISIYISVSNITTSEAYKENNWGTVGDTKSEITSKKLSSFLNRLNGNEIAQNFIIWFFEEIFNYERYIIGLQRNIHLYRKTLEKLDIEKDFLLRFEFNDKNKDLLLRFERGNNFSSDLLSKIEKMDMSYFDFSKKQIVLSSNMTVANINLIKDFLSILLIK